MRTVLFRQGPTGQRQQRLDFGATEREVDAAWEKAKTDTLSARTNTKFAQRRLDPEDVIPEWQKATQALGDPGEVEAFVKAACARLGAGLAATGQGWRLPYDHLPQSVQDRLADARIGAIRRVVFDQPVPHGHTLIHRTHPLVTALAETVSEIALERETPEVAARSYAVATSAVSRRTVLYHLRLRSRIIERDKRAGTDDTLLAEELVTVKVEGGRTLSDPEVLSEDEVRAFNQVELGEMDRDARVRAIAAALKDARERLQAAFEQVAEARADQVLKDHRRIRDAADLKGVTFQVKPSLPVDIVAVGVLLPDEDF